MKKKKVLKYLIIALVVLILFLIIGKKAGWFGQDYTYKVAVESPDYRTIVETVTANGKVQPETEVKISPEVSGEIIEITIEEGSKVKKGDLLVKIKPDTYQSMLDRAKASLNSSRAQYANSKAQLEQVRAKYKKAKRDYERNKELWEENTISEADYETALSSYEMAEAEMEAARQSVQSAKFSVESARASVKEAKENLQKTQIYSPMNGTVSRLNVEVGETVVGTKQMAGTELLRIADLDKMEVKVDVNENDIIKVTLGDTSDVEIDAYLGRKFQGVVSEIAHSASIEGASTDQVTSFEVKIHLLKESYKDLISPDNPYPFRPGLSATVEVKTEQHLNVLSLPIQAVTTRTVQSKNMEKKENIREVVFTVKNDSVRKNPVEIGIQDKQFIEILSGIDTTDKVVTAPYSAVSRKLKQGDKISVVKKEKLYEREK
jgi:HlyD family secretion protein